MRRAAGRRVAAVLAGGLMALGIAGIAAAEEKAAPAAPGAAEAGFVPIFNGKDLAGWEGNPDFWSVQDGAITGQTTKEKPAKGNTFLIWKGGEVKDFELRLEFKLENHNSGIQFRSKDRGNFVVGGYQADMDGGNRYTGMLYEEKGRGIMAKRGTKVVVHPDGKLEVVGKTVTEQEFAQKFKAGDWNDFTIIAKGNQLTLMVDGLVTSEMTDNQEAKRAMSGILALQLHAGPPMKVQFRNLRLKTLDAEEKK